MQIQVQNSNDEDVTAHGLASNNANETVLEDADNEDVAAHGFTQNANETVVEDDD
jgi:hypothetical protein